MATTLEPTRATAGNPRALAAALHIINGEHFSGAERVQDLLAGALPQFGYRIGFCALKPGRFDEARQHKSAPLFESPMRSRFDVRVARSIADFVDQGSYQLLHAHTPRSLMIARRVARRSGLPLIYHVHSPSGRDSTRAWRNRLNLWIETRQLRRADRLVCVSNSLADYMRQQGHASQKIRVVPNGVPAQDWFERLAPSSEWTIGTVALFRPRKGIELLLAALALARQQGLPLRLLAVGPFESEAYREDVLQLAQTLGVADQIEWTGFCRDVTPAIRRMDVFVLPSLFGEGLPMVVLEAMALGVPIVASNVEGIPEAVRDRQDGLIFAAGDPNALLGKLKELVDGRYDWSRLRRSAWQRQRSHFSDASMARQLAAIYDELLR